MNQQTIPAHKFETLCQSLHDPVFLGVFSAQSDTLHLYTTKKRCVGHLQQHAQEVFVELGIDVAVHYRAEQALEKAKALEDWIAPYRQGTIVFDPTGSVRRACAVVDAAKRIRVHIPEGIAGIALEPWKRTLFIGLDPNHWLDDTQAGVIDTLHEQIAALTKDWPQTVMDFLPSLKIGFGFPKPPVVAVDTASLAFLSATGRATSSARFKNTPVSAALAAALGVAGLSTALAEGPAVSGVNAKMKLVGGENDGDGAGLAVGSLTAPLGSSLGVQFDVLGGVVGDDARWGAGAQTFWRDPEVGLFGISGSYNKLSSDDVIHTGAEGELYLQDFTLRGRGEYQFGDEKHGVVGIGGIDWYPSDDFVIGGEARTEAGLIGAQFSAEYQPGFSALPGLTLFADGGFREDGIDQVFVGLKYYFGETKSLIRRHREDDPNEKLSRRRFTPGENDKVVPAAAAATPASPTTPTTPPMMSDDGDSDDGGYPFAT